MQLLDAADEEVLDFNYEDDWYPLTDGLGFSLVIVDENALPEKLGLQESTGAPARLSAGHAWERAIPLRPALLPSSSRKCWRAPTTRRPADSVELFNPTASDVDIGGWFVTDDFNTPKKFRVPDGTIIPARGFQRLHGGAVQS